MIFSFQRFFAVAKKEALELKRNLLLFLLTILAPLALYFLFAYGFPLDIKNISLGVIDHDKTALSRALIDSFINTRIFSLKKIDDNLAILEKEMSRETLRIILVIPSQFSAHIRKNRPAQIQLLIDGTHPPQANMIGGYAEATVAEFSQKILTRFFLKQLAPLGPAGSPLNLDISVWYNPSFRSEDFILPALIAIVMIFFPPLVATVALAREKETGAILHMYCSCITKTEYILGKMTPYIIISFFNTLLFLAATVFIFEVPCRGSLGILLVASFFYVGCVIGLGLIVAVLVDTQIAAILITAVATLTPSFLYSGFMAPLFTLTKNAKWIAYSIPSTYYIDLTRKIMIKGTEIRYLTTNVVMLVLFCIGLYTVSIMLFKKRLG